MAFVGSLQNFAAGCLLESKGQGAENVKSNGARETSARADRQCAALALESHLIYYYCVGNQPIELGREERHGGLCAREGMLAGLAGESLFWTPVAPITVSQYAGGHRNGPLWSSARLLTVFTAYGSVRSEKLTRRGPNLCALLALSNCSKSPRESENGLDLRHDLAADGGGRLAWGWSGV